MFHSSDAEDDAESHIRVIRDTLEKHRDSFLGDACAFLRSNVSDSSDILSYDVLAIVLAREIDAEPSPRLSPTLSNLVLSDYM